MKKILNLPIIINGELIYPSNEYIELEYTKAIVRITKPSKNEINKILSFNDALHDISVHEVTGYLSKFGSKFLEPGNKTFEEAVELSSIVTGYSKEMTKRCFYIISEYLLERHLLCNKIEAEFGDYRILDTWVRNQVARVRAFPRGRAFHILVGNVPLASMYSIVRSILTKNQTVAKLPVRDIISVLYFMKGLIEANGPSHPISRSLSALYLNRNSDDLDIIINNSDTVCAWGKGESLKKIKEKVPHSVPYLEAGPKSSYSILFLEECNYDKAAIRLAHDLCIYDQEACFSPQRLFVIGNVSKFLPHLKDWLNWQTKYLPKGETSPDSDSHLLRTKLEAIYEKWPIHQKDNDWCIIEANPYLLSDHPLSRTLFVHSINHEDEILPFIDDDIQTISVYPYKKDIIEKLGDKFCSRGAARICETGTASYPREGFTWDSMYGLHYFVRLCYLDESLNSVHKYKNREHAEWYLTKCWGDPIERKETIKDLWFLPTAQW